MLHGGSRRVVCRTIRSRRVNCRTIYRSAFEEERRQALTAEAGFGFGPRDLGFCLARQQEACHAVYVREALGLPPGAVARPPSSSPYGRPFLRLWRKLKWEPKHKEEFWQLAVDGIPLPANSHLPTVPREWCACGAVEAEASPRMHHFWACPIAVGLRSVRGRGSSPTRMPAAASILPLTQYNSNLRASSMLVIDCTAPCRTAPLRAQPSRPFSPTSPRPGSLPPASPLRAWRRLVRRLPPHLPRTRLLPFSSLAWAGGCPVTRCCASRPLRSGLAPSCSLGTWRGSRGPAMLRTSGRLWGCRPGR